MKRLILVPLVLLLVVPSARADHLESHIGPAEPARDFPADFLALLPEDAQATSTLSAWRDPRVGGWGGGDCPEDHEPRRPVVLVHGNAVDAGFWRAQETSDGTIVNVRQRLLAAGWCARELWAISYTGASGYTTYNDINVDELFAFVAAVRSYLGVEQVDVVAHSLGVTVVRKTARVHPEMLSWLGTFVAIAGANRGTTSCRGSGALHVSHVCEEVEPGSEWLAELNADGVRIDVPRVLTIYEGTGLIDTFYLGPDAYSPQLDGACNHAMPYVAHNTLARGRQAVETYAAFLQGASCRDLQGGGS